MEESENINVIYSGKSIAKNTLYNLFGYGIPAVFALVIIPFLIKGIGTEKFGILSLIWVIIGYFSFFDFGIGRASTKLIAEKIGGNQFKQIPGIFWTSFFLVLLISLIGALILFFFTPSLVYNYIKISKNIQKEVLEAFFLLALSIPIITTTAAIRGVLIAYQEFGKINIIRTFLGVSMFLGPLICLIFTDNLFWIALFLIIIRLIVWILYIFQCFRINATIKNQIYLQTKLIKPILKLSGWMTISGIIAPLIIYSDRFLIGTLVSATAIAYYATPYEAVTKLLLIPGALVSVLFPAFSASYLYNRAFTKKLAFKAVKYIFIFLFPIVVVLITFAHECMNIWLGKDFAANSSLILQLLAAGVLFNGIAYIPFNFLEGIGRPDLTAKVNLIELPVYFLGMWFAIKYIGINGAAFVWFLRMVIDALILFLFLKKIMAVHFDYHFRLSYLYILILGIASVFTIFISVVYIKIILVLVILTIFLSISWKFFLFEEDKMFLISRIKIFNS